MTADNSGERIEICELELMARIGVPIEERAIPQRLTVSMTLWPLTAFDDLDDEIANAVDYAAVCIAVKKLVSEREDKLIETLAAAIASHLLQSFAVRRVRVELRKFILSDARYTAVALVRERGERS